MVWSDLRPVGYSKRDWSREVVKVIVGIEKEFLLMTYRRGGYIVWRWLPVQGVVTPLHVAGCSFSAFIEKDWYSGKGPFSKCLASAWCRILRPSG